MPVRLNVTYSLLSEFALFCNRPIVPLTEVTAVILVFLNVHGDDRPPLCK